MDKIYHFFLWFTGFQEGEHITDMLRRQKARLGIWWWFFPLGTIAFVIWLILHVIERKK